MDLLTSSFFWVTLAQIMMINIMLSGDNAVVIAMASRALPPRQQKQAILFGSFGAIVLRVILTFFAVFLLALPFLKIVGALLLGLDRHSAAHTRRTGGRARRSLQSLGRHQDDHRGGFRDEPRQRARRRGRCEGQRGAARDRSRDQHSADHLRQHDHSEADEPLADHRDNRRRHTRLGRGRNAGHRPCHQYRGSMRTRTGCTSAAP